MSEQKPCLPECMTYESQDIPTSIAGVIHARGCHNALGAAEAEGSCYADETREPGYYDKFDPKPAPEPQAEECICQCSEETCDHANDWHHPYCPKHVPQAEEPIDPLQTMDAQLWAREFLRCYENAVSPLDEGWMISWFSNAIMRGFDEGTRRAQAENAALKAEVNELARDAESARFALESAEAMTDAVAKNFRNAEAERDALAAKLENEKAEHDITEMGLKGAMRQNKALAAKLADMNRIAEGWQATAQQMTEKTREAEAKLAEVEKAMATLRDDAIQYLNFSRGVKGNANDLRDAIKKADAILARKEAARG